MLFSVRLCSDLQPWLRLRVPCCQEPIFLSFYWPICAILVSITACDMISFAVELSAGSDIRWGSGLPSCSQQELPFCSSPDIWSPEFLCGIHCHVISRKNVLWPFLRYICTYHSRAQSNIDPLSYAWV